MTEMTKRAVERLTADAKNRSWRTALQGLAIDVLVAVGLVLSTTLLKANDWSEVEWAILGFSVLKSAVQAAVAYLMRRYLDPSKVPTPLPPEDSGPPTEDTDPPKTETGRRPAKKPAKRARRDRGEVDLLTALGLLGIMLVLVGLIVSRLLVYVGMSFLLFALILVVANRNRL